MIVVGQNLLTGQYGGFLGPPVASTLPVQVSMALWQSGTTRVDSLSVEQALRDMKMRFVYPHQLDFVWSSYCCLANRVPLCHHSDDDDGQR